MRLALLRSNNYSITNYKELLITFLITTLSVTSLFTLNVVIKCIILLKYYLVYLQELLVIWTIILK